MSLLFFGLKSSLGWAGGKYLPPITIFYWPEITLKVWAKSELVKFFPDWGCPPPFFCLKSSFGWGGGEIFTSNHNLLLAWGYPESLSQIWVGYIFPWFGMFPLFLCLKSNFGWGGLGVKFSPSITIFYWPEVTLKVWAKSELVKFFPDLGCPPLFFA